MLVSYVLKQSRVGTNYLTRNLSALLSYLQRFGIRSPGFWDAFTTGSRVSVHDVWPPCATPPFATSKQRAFAWGDNVSSSLKYSTRYYVACWAKSAAWWLLTDGAGWSSGLAGRLRQHAAAVHTADGGEGQPFGLSTPGLRRAKNLLCPWAPKVLTCFAFRIIFRCGGFSQSIISRALSGISVRIQLDQQWAAHVKAYPHKPSHMPAEQGRCASLIFGLAFK